MKRALIGMFAAALFAGPAMAQGERQRPRPTREELREDLKHQLERLQMRERWLKRQIEAIDRGETPEPPMQRGPHEPDRHQTEPRIENDDEAYLAVLRDLQEDSEFNGGKDSPFQRVLETDGPERERLIRRLAPRLQRLVDLKDRDPERYDATKQEMLAGLKIAKAARALSIAMQDSESTEEELAFARDDLRNAIALGFDARAAMTRYELRDAEQRLNELSAEVSKAESEREQRINEQYEHMLERIESGEDDAKPSRHDRDRGPSQRERGQKLPSRDD